MKNLFRPLFFLTALNLALALSLFIIGTLAGVAAEAPTWVLLYMGVVPIAGLVVSAFAVWRLLDLGIPTRILVLLLNAPAAILHAMALFSVLGMLFGTVQVTYILPEAYRGEVYVLYGIPGGKSPETGNRKITFEIPDDGVLAVRSNEHEGWQETRYLRRSRDGRLTPISETWFTTVPRTPENLGNDSDLAVFYPSSGVMGTEGCSVRYKNFHVGTKASFLSLSTREDLEKFRTFPGTCLPAPF